MIRGAHFLEETQEVHIQDEVQGVPIQKVHTQEAHNREAHTAEEVQEVPIQEKVQEVLHTPDHRLKAN